MYLLTLCVVFILIFILNQILIKIVQLYLLLIK